MIPKLLTAAAILSAAWWFARAVGVRTTSPARRHFLATVCLGLVGAASWCVVYATQVVLTAQIPRLLHAATALQHAPVNDWDLPRIIFVHLALIALTLVDLALTAVVCLAPFALVLLLAAFHVAAAPRPEDEVRAIPEDVQ